VPRAEQPEEQLAKPMLSPDEEAAESERGLANGLELLAPMKEKCLFLRPGNGWFTYAFW